MLQIKFELRGAFMNVRWAWWNGRKKAEWQSWARPLFTIINSEQMGLKNVTKMQEVITVAQGTPKWNLSVKLELKKENNDSNTKGDAPPIRNINACAVMKSICTCERPMSHSRWSTGRFSRSNVQQAAVCTLRCQEAQGLSLKSALTWMR